MQKVSLRMFSLNYEGESTNNQSIPFPMDWDFNDCHAMFLYILYVGTKLHAYRVIL